jgi:capsular polysaccharide export protein
VGLGCLFTKPWSLVFDTCGIYYDSSQPSDLENILRHKEFSPKEIQRARQLIEKIRLSEVTKYNVGDPIQAPDVPKFHDNRPTILVPGQVEDDASILHGTNEINSNLRLLQATRELNPSAQIIYKPHPDLQFIKKHLQIPRNQILAIADQIIMDVAIVSLLQHMDSVYTMTSLTGFEALLQGKKVHCFGLPFYAGWGLTQDHVSSPRRDRRRTLEELVAAAYIDYPRYYHWFEKKPCKVEEVLSALQRKDIQAKINWKQRIGRSALNGFKKIKNVFAQ